MRKVKKSWAWNSAITDLFSCLLPGRVKKLQKFINFCLKVGHSANLKYSKSTWRQSSCDFCEMYKISTSLYISFFLSHHIYPLFISESLHLSEPIIITNFLGLFRSVCTCQLIFCNLFVYDRCMTFADCRLQTADHRPQTADCRLHEAARL